MISADSLARSQQSEFRRFPARGCCGERGLPGLTRSTPAGSAFYMGDVCIAKDDNVDGAAE